MEFNNLPPFYIGQEVVCVDNKTYIKVHFKTEDMLHIGETYIIRDIRKGCCEWEIDIGILAKGKIARCICGKASPLNTYSWFKSSRFVPKQEQFQAITYSEIKQKESPLICVN